MSAQFKTAIPVDLSRPPHTEPLPHQLALKDSDSFVLTALVYDSSAAEPTEVMAGTVTGAALRPDGATAALTGEKGAELVTVTDAHGNAWKATPCSVTVSQQALLHPGRVILSVKLTDEGDTTTVLTASFTVNRTNSDQLVDGGDVIITIDTLIGEIEDAAADAAQAKADAEAAAAAAESPVSYAAQTLTDAQKAQARTNIAAGAASDVATLMTAVDNLNPGNPMLTWNWVQGGYGDLSENPPVSVNSSTSRIRTCVTVQASQKVVMTCLSGWQFCYSVYVDGERQEYNASWTSGPNTKTWAFGAGTYTVYISFAKSSNGTILPSEAKDGLTLLADDAIASITGEILDNKAAVEALNDTVNEMLPGNPMLTWQWQQGIYSDISENPPATTTSGSTRIRLKVTFDAKTAAHLTCAAGFKYGYSVYVDNVRKDYKSNAWVSGPSVKDFAYGAGTYTVYLNLAKSSDAAITPDEAEGAVTLLADNAVENVYDAIAEQAAISTKRNLFDPLAANSIRGYYNSSNVWMNADLGQTDLIPVEQGRKYVSSETATFVNWYDSSKAFLSSTPSATYSSQGYVIPVTGAAYARFIIPLTNVTNFYVYSDEADDKEIVKQAVPYGVRNPYAGKKAVAFGTSLTYRAKTSGGYLEFLPCMAQMTVDNQGLGNSTVVPHPEHTDMMGKITGYTGFADKDIVLLEGFVNDWYDNSDKLGTWTDTTTDTVCGAIRYIIDYIREEAPDATLIMILDPYGQSYGGDPGCASTVVKSGRTQMEYYDEIAKVAASLAVPVIKGYAVSGMCEATPDYYIDIIHPSPAGAKRFADVVWAEMQHLPPR